MALPIPSRRTRTPRSHRPGNSSRSVLAWLMLGAMGIVAPAACGGSGDPAFECDAAGKEAVYVCAPAGGAACPAAGTQAAADLVHDPVQKRVDQSCGDDPDCWCDANVEKVHCGPDPGAKTGQCCYFVEYSEEAWCA